jgi:hypothetical protein
MGWTMIAMTLAMLVLTGVVAWYAWQTLKVTRESLHFFSRPRVYLDCRSGTELRPFIVKGKTRWVWLHHLDVWNDSALDIRIERVGFRPPEVISIQPDTYRLDQVVAEFGKPHNDNPLVEGHWDHWPAIVRKRLRLSGLLRWRGPPYPDSRVTMRVLFQVEYIYCGKTMMAESQFDFELIPEPRTTASADADSHDSQAQEVKSGSHPTEEAAESEEGTIEDT